MATLAALSLFAAVVAGCGIKRKAESTPIQTECVLDTDQSGTLVANWKIGPVPVAWQSGSAGNAADFDAAEIGVHVAAFQGWNDFFLATKGGLFFDYGSASSPHRTATAPPPDGACPLRIVSGRGFSGKVSVHKIISGWSFGDSVIAVTTFCTDRSSPFNSISGAAMKFNYQDFGPPGGARPTPDWETIVKHEAGHLVGLDHSCEDGSGKAGMPRCSGGKTAYLQALMFPVLYSNGQAVVRRAIDANTQQRANCLYPL